MGVIASPVLYSTVLGVIDKPKLDCPRSVHVSMETGTGRRSPLGFDPKHATDSGSDSIRANDYIVPEPFDVGERDLAVLKVDILGLYDT